MYNTKTQTNQTVPALLKLEIHFHGTGVFTYRNTYNYHVSAHSNI